MLANRNHRTASKDYPVSEKSPDFASIIAPFRAWAKFQNSMPHQGLIQANATDPEGNIRRRDIWKAYYNTLSSYLQSNASFPIAHQEVHRPLGSNPSDPEDQNVPGPRLMQYEELSRVETVYEELLLKEISFPAAHQTNVEVDEWVEQVIANWRVTCGSNWRNADLGPGGQEAAGRKVLDVRQLFDGEVLVRLQASSLIQHI